MSDRPMRNGSGLRRKKTGKILAVLLLAGITAVLTACGAAKESAGTEKETEQPAQAAAVEEIRITTDGEILSAIPAPGDKAPGLWVTIAVDGQAVAELPFGEPRTVRILQDGFGENTVVLTGEAVYMEKADCPGQDCVTMGEVTRENLEMRVMGGFIICLPHRLSVEVWEKK